MKEKLIINLIRHIPLSVRRFLACLIARLSYYISLKHRLIAIHHLMRAFPDKSLKEIIVIAKESYAGFVLVVADFFDIPHLNKDNLHQWISIEGLDNYTEACKEGKGVLVFSAHFGNWEIGNAALAIMARPFVFIYRVFDSPLLEKAITGVRASYGNIKIIENKIRQYPAQ